MKELNKKEAIGDLLDAFTEVFYPAGGGHSISLQIQLISLCLSAGADQ